ncbi:MAG TPA: hypothetical protein PK074_12465 [Spirochaetales bacterium]|nr:hypothetical protein [Spirochaetales bacterium]
MKVFDLTADSIPAVAQLMCRIKADWWDYEGAIGQLSDINESIKTVGWYLGDDVQHPKGWILCRELVGYRAIDLECSGFDDNGTFKLEHKLGQLFQVVQDYARKKGYLTFRSGISSIGFNIHGKEIQSIPDAIQTLSCERIDYCWYLENGFRVIGIQPNAYEKGFHLIMLGKEI